jgi:hypothetical protein
MWKKNGRARQATDDNMIRPMCFPCWIAKDTDTDSVCVALIAFPANAPQFYVYAYSQIAQLWHSDVRAACRRRVVGVVGRADEGAEDMSAACHLYVSKNIRLCS